MLQRALQKATRICNRETYPIPVRVVKKFSLKEMVSEI